MKQIPILRSIERVPGGLMVRAESVGLETIHAGVESLGAALARHAAAGVEAVICDAETDDDLRHSN